MSTSLSTGYAPLILRPGVYLFIASGDHVQQSKLIRCMANSGSLFTYSMFSNVHLSNRFEFTHIHVCRVMGLLNQLML